MQSSDLHFFPLALPFVLGLFLLMGLLMTLIEVGILKYAYTKIGVDRHYVFKPRQNPRYTYGYFRGLPNQRCIARRRMAQ